VTGAASYPPWLSPAGLVLLGDLSCLTCGSKRDMLFQYPSLMGRREAAGYGRLDHGWR
jgi:hypothetical protein